jgi:hypothetical protein
MTQDIRRVYHDEEEMERIAKACELAAEEELGSDEQDFREIQRKMERVDRHERADPEFEETLQDIVEQIVETIESKAEQYSERSDGDDPWQEVSNGLSGFAESLRQRAEKRDLPEADTRTVEDIKREMALEFLRYSDGMKSNVRAIDFIAFEWAGMSIEQISNRRGVGEETIRYNVKQAGEWVEEGRDVMEDQSTLADVEEDG